MRLLLISAFCVFTFATGAQTAGPSQETAESLYNEGLQLKKNGKSSDAAGKFMDALRLKPDYTEARYELAWCQNDIKAYSGAIDNLRKVRTVWSTIPKVYFELGYAFEKNGDADSAISAYNKCLYYKPDYYSVYKQLGTIAYNREDNKTALDYFNKYVTNYTQEITDYTLWYRKGYTENALKKYDLAKQSLLNALKYKTDYINIYLELGFACKNLKQDEEAISYYQQAIHIDPKNYIPYNGTAEVYRDNKADIDKAKEWYTKSLEVNSTDRKANFGMGYCLNSQQKYNEAIGYLKKAIENEKTYTAAYVELGYSQYKTNDFSSALANFDKAIQLSPTNENSRYYAALVYMAQKNKTMAQKMVDELKVLNSKYAVELQNRVNGM